ncbi:hypothetical protein PR048_008095 [Dryococelus australis]|uniref:Uncharacterized protein n=1 Tax=Dryococelus australis TaxID=614101 RepID=A0ABQ9HW41_9NEOP|nr:hypothetical protein PR048_008095 [Dryococelus australis]
MTIPALGLLVLGICRHGGPGMSITCRGSTVVSVMARELFVADTMYALDPRASGGVVLHYVPLAPTRAVTNISCRRLGRAGGPSSVVCSSFGFTPFADIFRFRDFGKRGLPILFHASSSGEFSDVGFLMWGVWRALKLCGVVSRESPVLSRPHSAASPNPMTSFFSHSGWSDMCVPRAWQLAPLGASPLIHILIQDHTAHIKRPGRYNKHITSPRITEPAPELRNISPYSLLSSVFRSPSRWMAHSVLCQTASCMDTCVDNVGFKENALRYHSIFVCRVLCPLYAGLVPSVCRVLCPPYVGSCALRMSGLVPSVCRVLCPPYVGSCALRMSGLVPSVCRVLCPPYVGSCALRMSLPVPVVCRVLCPPYVGSCARRAAVAKWLNYSPPTKAVRFLAGSLLDFRVWESCRTMPLVGGVFFFLVDLPSFNLFHSGAVPNSRLFTLTSSQNLDVKSRPNLFISHSLIGIAFRSFGESGRGRGGGGGRESSVTCTHTIRSSFPCGSFLTHELPFPKTGGGRVFESVLSVCNSSLSRWRTCVRVELLRGRQASTSLSTVGACRQWSGVEISVHLQELFASKG